MTSGTPTWFFLGIALYTLGWYQGTALNNGLMGFYSGQEVLARMKRNAKGVKARDEGAPSVPGVGPPPPGDGPPPPPPLVQQQAQAQAAAAHREAVHRAVGQPTQGAQLPHATPQPRRANTGGPGPTRFATGGQGGNRR